MGKFHLFAGERYYPLGGMDDYRGSFDSVEAAIEHVRKISDRGDHTDLSWANLAIIDDTGNLKCLFDWDIVEGGNVEERR